jgi:hypothetical protein
VVAKTGDLYQAKTPNTVRARAGLEIELWSAPQ